MVMTVRTCELYNEDNDRKAVVFVDKSLGEDVWCVDCYDGAHFVRLIECKGHSEQYAYDAAENWVNKWGSFA